MVHGVVSHASLPREGGYLFLAAESVDFEANLRTGHRLAFDKVPQTPLEVRLDEWLLVGLRLLNPTGCEGALFSLCVS
jgi:hypothetical protein